MESFQKAQNVQVVKPNMAVYTTQELEKSTGAIASMIKVGMCQLGLACSLRLRFTSTFVMRALT